MNGDRGMELMMRKGRSRVALAALVMALAGGTLLACSSATGVGDGQGHLTVHLTDAPFPFDLVSEANVTISRVDIVSEAGIQTIMEEERSFNLLELQNGVTAVLAEASLEPGPYSQIRLIVKSASVVLTDDREFDLFVPSGAETGIKVLLHDWEVSAEAETELTLDFEVDESFIVQGNTDSPEGIEGFLFRPVVHPVGLESEEEEADETDEG